MVLSITNFGGLFCLIYCWYNYELWTISINESNVLSAPFVSLVQNLPATLYLLILTLIYIIALYKNKGVLPIICYFFSLLLFEFLFKISLATLSLEDTTTFFLFKITIPVPLELKLFHVQNILLDLCISNPELLTNRLSLAEFQNLLNNHLDVNKIKLLNASEITEYIYKICNIQVEDPSKFQKLFYIITGVVSLIIFNQTPGVR